MVVKYELSGMDLGEVRFAISPINEVTLSLRVLRDPGRFPIHLRWLKATQPTLAGLDVEMLLALTNRDFWTPDFLTPTPRTPLTRFEDEIDLVASAGAHVISIDVAEVHPDRATRPAAVSGRSDRVRRRIVRALHDYWEACFAPYWPRMRSVLEADVEHRGRVIAQSGLSVMFADLALNVRLTDDVAEVTPLTGRSFRRSTAGDGLTLLPSLFGRRAFTPISPAQPPLISYPARGVGTLWESARITAPGALTDLIGGPARLLGALDSPASSTELAFRLDVTTSAINQHLRALRSGGLLNSTRHDRSVLYRRSDLGDQLIRANHT
jgi:hypothetical protein